MSDQNIKLGENHEKTTEQSYYADINKDSDNFENFGHSEASEFTESIDFSGEKISESGESKENEKKTSPISKKTVKKDDQNKQAIFRSLLINTKQSRGKLEGDLKKHYFQELKKLKKEAKKLKNKPHLAYQFTETWSKIKALYQNISSLATMTYDTLKKLWLKVVHGITVN
ncbi:hypothetical protein A2483_01365 [Candidatus Peregrinibacteria bacterium RIFOXYC2_FULL_33_13]|nr:MAG: hypothetical protein UR27_C0001G0062 [Candidatus Peregrinibacteria bacterium GW2011_GWA2_33_10]KKP39791.1 MAG: hypothetical protein UR30_C0008G0060 [Candidatus Peregrinibacteria bacterium GW2011_GWC2_33_13]OGJ56833.1 MAG: hypothetical protein A2483_01365 [Candidatus Peregrinibacteria bacterium RIFOXYC2_FULL_33_13]